MTETTRQLCAATYLDEQFCNHVIDSVVERPYQVIYPSSGVDVAAVAGHALAAARRRQMLDSVFCVLFVTALAYVLVTVLIVRFDDTVAGHRFGAVLDRLSYSALAAIWVVACAAMAVELWWRRYMILVRTLSRASSHPADPPMPTQERHRARLRLIADMQTGNVRIFSGREPFDGSGRLANRFAFSVDVEKAAVDDKGKPKEKKPFDVGDLYDSLTHNLPTVGLPQLDIQERLFLQGIDAASVPELLPEPLWPPSLHAGQALLRKALNVDRMSPRTYLCFEVIGWQGHLVVTMFLRAVRIQGSLYLEWTATELLPLGSHFFLIDRLSPRVGDAIVRAAFKSVLKTGPSLLGSPFRIGGAALRQHKAFTRARKEHDQIIYPCHFDYGAPTSLRAQAAGPSYNWYFLRRDADLYLRVVRERVFQHIFDFLKDHNVDTSSFEKAQSTINNIETYIVGGSVGPGAAVGTNARGGNVSHGGRSSDD